MIYKRRTVWNLSQLSRWHTAAAWTGDECWGQKHANEFEPYMKVKNQQDKVMDYTWNEFSFHSFIKEKEFSRMAQVSTVNSWMNGDTNTDTGNTAKGTGLGEKRMSLFLVMLSLESETFKMYVLSGETFDTQSGAQRSLGWRYYNNQQTKTLKVVISG